MLSIGKAAPDFELESTSGQKVKLSDYKGKKNVLLYFYPFDFSPVCTDQHCAYTKDFSEFEKLGVEILSISADSKFCHVAFREKFGIKEHLLADLHRDAIKKYGVLFELLNCSKRAYFLVGKDGNIKWMHIEQELPNSRKNEEIIDAIKKAIA